MTAKVSFVGLIMYQVIHRDTANSASRYFLCHAKDQKHALEQVANAYPGCVIDSATVLSEKFAESIIGENAGDYDATEVHGMRKLYAASGRPGSCFEVDEEDPEFYSTYVHLKEGGIECIGDFGTKELALQYAQEIDKTYGFARS